MHNSSSSSLRWPTCLVAAALAAFAVVAGCAPSPRSLPCSNAGQRETAGAQFHYCLQSHCVECVSNGGCGEGSACIDGACVTKCSNAAACPTGQCVDGACEKP